MTTVGFHASHEQLPPSDLLLAVRRAEEAGFQTAMCSDHLSPWSERQGHSCHAWTWLGAALGVDALALHHVGQEQERFVDVFGAEVLPELAS